VAAIVGDQVGYMFGRKVGPTLFTRPNSRLFKQENVAKAHDFFEKHGPRSIVLARFVPIVRTFTPIVAGIGAMRYRTFVTYNVAGGLLWAVGITLLGHFLGEIELIRENIELAIVAVVALSLLPVAIEIYRSRRAAQQADVVSDRAP
jgi:membrane-associated protein